MKAFFLTRWLLVLTLVVALGEAVRAQAPSSGGPTPGALAPTAIPLDGGAALLLAGGIAYGIKHLRNRRKKN